MHVPWECVPDASSSQGRLLKLCSLSLREVTLCCGGFTLNLGDHNTIQWFIKTNKSGSHKLKSPPPWSVMNGVRVVGIQRHDVNHYLCFREAQLNIKTLTLRRGTRGAEGSIHTTHTHVKHIRAWFMYACSESVLRLWSHTVTRNLNTPTLHVPLLFTEIS